jgi:aspartokinase/homoserine dehydrogenase 1
MGKAWAIQKFGGTSVKDAGRIRRASMVVSALGGVTDALLELVDLARSRGDGLNDAVESLANRHRETAADLLDEKRQKIFEDHLNADLEDLHQLLRAISIARHPAQAVSDYLVGYGEVWSALLLSQFLLGEGVAAHFLDARDVLVVEEGELGPLVEWEETQKRVRQFLDQDKEPLPEVLVITGFVATTTEGVPTTLRRNGSDYTASIFGALLEASSITIWTDVDGVLSADPRRVPDAVTLAELSYEEAMELAYFGAKVLHPATMAPAVKNEIPIWIKNTANPEGHGTCIKKRSEKIEAASDARHAVRGFSTVDQVCLLNLEGTGLIGIPGVAERLFGALREVGVSVIMISQASSEHSICCAIFERDKARAEKVVKEAFFPELHRGQILTVDLIGGCTVVAAVGDQMAATPGVAGTFMGSLGKAGINILAVAQGSSERNISVVVEEKEAARALRAVHAGFFLSEQTLSLGLVGPGLIGKELLSQLAQQADQLKNDFAVDVRLRGIADSKHMLLSEGPIPLSQWADEFAKADVSVDLNAFASHIQAEHLPHAVILDCTANDEVAGKTPEWLSRGIHVVTPNKKGNAGPLNRYKDARRAARRMFSHYYTEATVGAGLPIISTLRDLVQTGDRVLSIDGVFSGTLAYLFNVYDGTVAFSQIVSDARDKGYTEPDPRDDLSGLDVARKAVILAREMGREVELSDVQIESLVPEALNAAKTPEDFLEGLKEFDDQMAQRLTEAREKNSVLRYVAAVPNEGPLKVQLQVLPADHAFAGLSGSDNIIAFRTQRYDAQPLIVRGPGAGPAVTAGGVFADLLRLAARLGAPS